MNDDIDQNVGESCEHCWHGDEPCPYCIIEWKDSKLWALINDIELVMTAFPEPTKCMLIKLHSQLKTIALAEPSVSELKP